jgi:CRISPR system Cascade subunit CasE
VYLTRIELDTRRRSTMKALVSPNLIHGAVEGAFQGEKTRKLWRIDNLGGRCYLLLLSDKLPDMEHVSEQFGVAGVEGTWESKDYGKLLERIENGSVWQFRLTANPTRSCRGEKGTRGTIRAHVTPYYQKQWLMERSEKNGFNVKEDGFGVTKSYWQRFYKGCDRKNPLSILTVTYEGILTVTDVELFRKVLTEGIGREKAFGMGMLTVVRAGGI